MSSNILENSTMENISITNCKRVRIGIVGISATINNLLYADNIETSNDSTFGVLSFGQDLNLKINNSTIKTRYLFRNFIYANNLKYESKVAKDKTAATALATSAVYYYNQAIGLQPNYPEFYFKLGSTYRYNLNNLDSAERHFKNAVLIDTLYADAKYELSKLYFDKQDYRRSTYFFKQTYELKPTDSLTLFYYAQSAANSGDMATCYKINQEFLKLYPELPYPYLNLGTYYSTILKDDSAVIYFEKAIGIGYRETELLNKLAYYFEQKGNPEKAAYYRKLN